MKSLKIFCIPFATAVIFACSSDEQSGVNPTNFANPNFAASQLEKLNATDLTAATSLFNTMLASTAWSDFEASRVSFTAKLNGNLPGTACTDKSMWMTWIATNLASTNWPSVSAFEFSLDDLSAKWITVYNANTSLWVRLNNADDADRRIVMTNFWGTPPAQGKKAPCENACYAVMDVALDNLQDELDNISATGNPFLNFFTVISYWGHFESIVWNMNVCVAHC